MNNQAETDTENPKSPGIVPAKWQPIETAPMDGTSILVCNATLSDAYCVVGYLPDSAYPNHVWAPLDGGSYHKNAFTHWMPLPEAPTP